MKILQVVPFFSPEYGGSAVVPYYLAKELVKKGHEVDVFTSDYRLSQEWIKSLRKVRVCSFRTWFRGQQFYVTPGLIKQLRKDIRRYDVIHMHNHRSFQNIVLHHYATKHNVPYVLQAHGSLPRIMAKQRLKIIYDVFFGYRLLRDASKVIALSRMEAEQYKSAGVLEEKIAIIPNGIDLSEYANLPPRGAFRKKFGIDENEKIVLYLGRIHRIKGLDILARAFSKVVKELDGVRLVAAGPDDGYLDELESLIRVLKIEDNVLIPGPLYGQDKLEAYVDADLCVLPSRYDIWGMTVLEAIACGTPVIVTENCGIADYFTDKIGLIVRAEPNHVAEALLELLLDKNERDSFRMNCHSIKEDLSISKIVSKLEEVYEEIQ